MGGHGHKRSRVERRARGQKREPTAADGGDCGVCWCGERDYGPLPEWAAYTGSGGRMCPAVNNEERECSDMREREKAEKAEGRLGTNVCIQMAVWTV